jgi:hypothetical protein
MATFPILTTVNPGNASNVIVTFYVSNASQVQPAQQVTVQQSPASNPSFNRNGQLSTEYLFIKRGTGVFAFPLADLAGIAASQVPALSYSPLITLQPASLSVVSGNGNYSNFTTAANSESTLSYAWAANNGSGWVTSISNTVNNGGGWYSLTNATTLKITPASNSPNSISVLCIVGNATGNTNTDTAILSVS